MPLPTRREAPGPRGRVTPAPGPAGLSPALPAPAGNTVDW